MMKSLQIFLLMLLVTVQAVADEIRIHVDADLRRKVTAPRVRRLVGGFHPNWIEVSKGDRVTIELTSEQGTHSLAIPEYGVKSQPVGEGQTTTINFVADKTGEFRIECASECEGLHRAMVGTLVVREPDE